MTDFLITDGHFGKMVTNKFRLHTKGKMDVVLTCKYLKPVK